MYFSSKHGLDWASCLTFWEKSYALEGSPGELGLLDMDTLEKEDRQLSSLFYDRIGFKNKGPRNVCKQVGVNRQLTFLLKLQFKEIFFAMRRLAWGDPLLTAIIGWFYLPDGKYVNVLCFLVKHLRIFAFPFQKRLNHHVSWAKMFQNSSITFLFLSSFRCVDDGWWLKYGVRVVFWEVQVEGIITRSTIICLFRLHFNVS